MDKAGKEVGVDFVGGFSALVHKGASKADHKPMDSIPTPRPSPTTCARR